MKRRMFSFLVLFSLLLCVAVVVLWVRSYWVSDMLCWDRGESSASRSQSPESRTLHGTQNTQLGLRSLRGKLEFGWLEYPLPQFDYWEEDEWFGSYYITGKHYQQKSVADMPAPPTEYIIPGPGGLFDPSARTVPIPPEPLWRRLGFSYDEISTPPMFDMGVTYGPDGGEIYAIPHWLVVLLTAVTPSIFLARAIRSRRRAKAGLCLKCGYDLRASVDRCPECGTAIGVEIVA